MASYDSRPVMVFKMNWVPWTMEKGSLLNNRWPRLSWHLFSKRVKSQYRHKYLGTDASSSTKHHHTLAILVNLFTPHPSLKKRWFATNDDNVDQHTNETSISRTLGKAFKDAKQVRDPSDEDFTTSLPLTLPPRMQISNYTSCSKRTPLRCSTGMKRLTLGSIHFVLYFVHARKLITIIRSTGMYFCLPIQFSP